MTKPEGQASSFAGFALRTTCLLTIVIATTSVAGADIMSPAFLVQATNETGTGTFEVSSDEMTYDPVAQTYSWAMTGSVDIVTETQDVVAVLTGGEIIYKEDPQIALGFSVAAGLTDTTFLISSGLLSFPAIALPEAVASAGLTLTDTSIDGSGATLTEMGPGTGSYVAAYGGGTVFADLLPGLSTTGSISQSAIQPLASIGGPVSDMGAAFAFKVSAEDLASGTSNFVIIPEPAGLALLLVAGLSVAARRRA